MSVTYKRSNHFTSKNNAPVALICSPINLEVAPSTVETSTYLRMPIAWKEVQHNLNITITSGKQTIWK